MPTRQVQGAWTSSPRAVGAETDHPATAVRALYVAVVDEELPYPLTSGKRIRSFNLITRLARRHRVTYLCYRNADANEAKEAAVVFADHGIETLVVDRVLPAKSGPGFYARLAANLFSAYPYSVASHYSRAMVRAIHNYAAHHQVDLFQCEWTPYAVALRGLSQARRLIIAHNVESLIWQRYYEAEPQPFKRWYIKEQWRKFERFEKQALAEASRTVMVSQEDATLVQRRFGAERIDVVENGVDTRYFQPQKTPRHREQILFLGSLDWRPNLDAVERMLQLVYPQVCTQEPSARLCIVGRNPPEWLRRRIQEMPGARLHASVADVRPYLHQSGVMAVPLRIGGGSRLKILESLACGLPVVSSTVGAEGLCLKSGRDLIVVDRLEDMATAIVSCIREPARAREMAEQGRRVVLERYDWDILADKLERVWARCVSAESL